MKNKISIILPCYNGEKFVANTIKSILNQSYKYFDLYLVNNGSHDNSLIIMKSFKKIDKRIKIINFKKKTSKAKSINLISKFCDTKYICIMDADDLMHKDLIKVKLNYLKKFPKIKVLSCIAKYIGSNDKIFGITTNQLTDHYSCFSLIENSKNIGILCPGVIIERNVYLEVNGMNENIWPGEDIDLWNRIAQKGYIVYSLQKILMYYRIHDNSSINTNFLKSRLISSWLKENLLRENSKIKKISYNQFINLRKKKSFLIKLIFFFEDYSDLYFRKSLLFKLKDSYVNSLIYLGLSLIINPIRFVKKTTNILNKYFSLS